jgi:uncharacterized protein (DUF1501 family)
MLTLLGRPDPEAAHDFSPLTRRNFLRIGGLVAGGLSLGQLLSIEASAKTGRSHKALINIYLCGGPSHIDMFDLKPDAPPEIRGEFRPIGTNVPGIRICELFPRMAKMMDKFALIRSIVDSDGLHDAYQCMTGRKRKDPRPAGDWPSLGAFVSKLEGPVTPGVPANASLMYPTGNPFSETGGSGFAGAAHEPLCLVNKNPEQKPEGLVLKGMTPERLQDRVALLEAVDTFRRDADRSGVMEKFDHYGRQAIEILNTSKLAEALDLSKEDPKILERYGPNDPKYHLQEPVPDGAPRMIRNLCVARRLVEAGARVVSLNYTRWDWHGIDGKMFPKGREQFPLLDQGLSALVTDLHERGLDKDVSVVVWGEFSRTPRINQANSRDHWSAVNFALLAGGGMKTGQVIGATDRLGEHVIERPVTFQEVFATLYNRMGIDIETATVEDRAGRPQYLVDSGVKPLRELI